MEMKQKEQEINKRKKRLLWKEKRMKETVLNAMNPVEREIFEKELQKVHLKKSTALNDIGKTVWDTKKIRELLDQDEGFICGMNCAGPMRPIIWRL